MKSMYTKVLCMEVCMNSHNSKTFSCMLWIKSTINYEWGCCSAVSIIFLCWVLAFLEPAGLRLQNLVMCYYYPERARQRAVWLYNHILRSRGSFLKFIRRQLRRKFGKTKDGVTEKISLMDRLRATWVWFFWFWRSIVSCLECHLGAVH